ncbi:MULTISPECIES: hypothetical protein [unclassified Oerskovia]|nr:MULTISPECIES: hypothetical protein [unclassified Oerskovia]
MAAPTALPLVVRRAPGRRAAFVVLLSTRAHAPGPDRFGRVG